MQNNDYKLKKVKQQIRQYCEQYGRDPQSVELVAVSKKHSVQNIIEFAEQGQIHFGENYLQESVEKIKYCRQFLGAKADKLEWHFIGHIQSRKCADIAKYFNWVDTVESLKVANKLNQHRENNPLNILIQVNIDKETTKSGVSPDELLGFVQEVITFPNLKIRGLMIIPKARHEFSNQRDTFAQCSELLKGLNRENKQKYDLDQLSMGMSNDLEAAIAEGATQVRIGTALFGSRTNVALSNT